MMRFVNVLALAVTIMFAFGLYTLKYNTVVAQDKLRMIDSQIEEQEEALRVLRAEWAHLNQADRLEMLAAKYLELEAVTPVQVADLKDVPSKPLLIGDALAESSTSNIDGSYVVAPEFELRVIPKQKPINFIQRRQE